MGCMPSKAAQDKIAHSSVKVTPIQTLSDEDKTTFFKVRLMDAVKRQDVILLQNTLQHYPITPTEYIGNVDQKKNILHWIAQYNFIEGMIFALEYFANDISDQLSQALEAKDINGNTPSAICYHFDSTETLETLTQFIQNGSITKGSTNMNLRKSNLLQESRLTDDASTVQQTPTPIANTNLFSGQSSFASPRVRNPVKHGTLRDKDDEFGPPSTRLSVQIKTLTSVSKDYKISSNAKISSLLNELAGNNTNFIDQEFPHDTYSIAGPNGSGTDLVNSKSVKWARPQDILKYDPTAIKLFEDIDVANISENPLAGCDLYSVLAALTEYPQRLIKSFITKEANKHGAYSVQLMVAGIPVEILLDDYFPCLKDSKIIFSKPVSNEIWFLLMEKAFAKLYGSYQEVKEVQFRDALELITGMPTSQQLLKDTNIDELWTSIMEYDKKNYIICAGNHEKKGQSQKNRIFTIVRLYETGNNRVVKLRNHFLDFEWEGEFSNKSSHWTKELNDQLGHFNGEKSCFYMDIKELVKEFEFLTVCHYHENWTQNSLEVVCKPNKAVFFSVDLDREMDVILSVHQKLQRFMDEYPDYNISPVEILVVEQLDGGILKKVAEGEKDAFNGKHTVFADDKIKIKLSEGRYFIRIKVRWVDGNNHSFTLNTYSRFPLTLKRSKQKNHANFLSKMYFDEGSSSTEKYQLGNKCEFASSWCGPHLWFYALNKGDKVWNLEIVFKKFENLKLCKKYRTNENSVKLIIPPKGQAVAYAKRINKEPYELNWAFNQSWE